MKIGLIADNHIGYFRFEKDAYIQAKHVLEDAVRKSVDIIIHLGDISDNRTPRLEAIEQIIELLKIPANAGIPVYAIHGNHERRGKGLKNIVEVLNSTGLIKYISNDIAYFEKDGEKIGVLGVGNVPDDYASEVIKKVIELKSMPKSDFNILAIHQTITDFVPESPGLSLKELDAMGFDLIANGHIHTFNTALSGKLIIPGSTVITQLRKDETKSKGYVIYDTKRKDYEFVEIKSRPFIFKNVEVKNAGASDIIDKVYETVKEILGRMPDKNERMEEDPSLPIIKIRLTGTLKPGVKPSDVLFNLPEFVYCDNMLMESSAIRRIEKIRMLRSNVSTIDEIMMSKIKEVSKGKIKMFDPVQLFMLLVEDSDKAKELLNL